MRIAKKLLTRLSGLSTEYEIKGDVLPPPNLIFLLGKNKNGLIKGAINVQGIGGCRTIPTIPRKKLTEAVITLNEHNLVPAAFALVSKTYKDASYELHCDLQEERMTRDNQFYDFWGSNLFSQKLPVVVFNQSHPIRVIHTNWSITDL